jgi:hypothetical protein
MEIKGKGKREKGKGKREKGKRAYETRRINRVLHDSGTHICRVHLFRHYWRVLRRVRYRLGRGSLAFCHCRDEDGIGEGTARMAAAAVREHNCSIQPQILAESVSITFVDVSGKAISANDRPINATVMLGVIPGGVFGAPHYSLSQLTSPVSGPR